MTEYEYELNIRRLHDNDLIDAFRMRNDARLWRWFRQPRPLSWAEHVHWFSSLAGDQQNIMFAITDLDYLKGVCGLTSIDRINQHAEISLYIACKDWRKGIGSQALGFLFEHAFLRENLNHLWIEAYEGSPAIPFVQTLGMMPCGVRPKFYFREGKFVDAHLFSITRDQWNESRFSRD